MSQPGFVSQQEEVLRNTKITSEAPGTILHDFQVLLDFATEVTLYLTDAHVLPMKALEPLNQRLLRRIEHGLARPQQKSYPHINGSFLLLRATGMTLVDATGRKPILVIDPAIEDSWRKLNHDEQYFTLLESWLMRGDSAIIEERSRPFDLQPPLYLWSDFFQRLEQQEWYNSDWAERVRYWPSLHHLALMELFGLVQVDDAPAEPKKGWQIADVRATKWGEALLDLLTSQLQDDLEYQHKLSRPYEVPPGELQPLLQPYRAHWQHALQLPDMAFQEGLFVFKVSLDRELWRQVIIPAQSTLDDLSDAILSAYRFDHDHLYRFIYPTRFGVTAEVLHPYMDRGSHADEVRIGDLSAQPGFQMVYNYDFGDNWHFHILLERIDPHNSKAPHYRVGKRKGKSPEQYPSWD